MASIQISSLPGMGTTFTIMLPVTDGGRRNRSPSPCPTSGRRKGETILVVEDEDELREATKRIFARTDTT